MGHTAAEVGSEGRPSGVGHKLADRDLLVEEGIGAAFAVALCHSVDAGFDNSRLPSESHIRLVVEYLVPKCSRKKTVIPSKIVRLW